MRITITRRALALALAGLLVLAGCAALGEGGSGMAGYTQIDQETARQMMRAHDDHVVVDVRRSDEYAEGHIPGAVLIPNETISDEPPERLPDPDQVILVYCRSGNRSKQAAQKLSAMGYTNVYEFGGVMTWPGPLVTDSRAVVSLSLSRTGSVFMDSYSLLSCDEGYIMSVSGGPDRPVDAEVAEALLALIDEYDLTRWDGFDRAEEGVLDGETFLLKVRLADGTGITASGDNAFPPNYFEVIGAMQRLLEAAAAE